MTQGEKKFYSVDLPDAGQNLEYVYLYCLVQVHNFPAIFPLFSSGLELNPKLMAQIILEENIILQQKHSQAKL